MEAAYMGTCYGGKGKPWIGVDMENGTGSHPRVFPSAALFFFFDSCTTRNHTVLLCADRKLTSKPPPLGRRENNRIHSYNDI
eukprot:COSAG06_NODE_11625_length_1484_cov_1.513357_1_plen_82_part_00